MAVVPIILKIEVPEGTTKEDISAMCDDIDFSLIQKFSAHRPRTSEIWSKSKVVWAQFFGANVNI